MRSPDRGESVERRQSRVGILRDVQNRKVVHIERIGQTGKRDTGKNELAGCSTMRHSHPMRLSIGGASESEECLRKRQAERQDEREMS
jgi:hypothetical protein